MAIGGEVVMTTEDVNRLEARLRETEAQTREQSVKIESLTNQMASLVEQSKKFMDLTEKRDERMWKLVVILVGALIGSTLGPKAASKIYSQIKGDLASNTVYMLPLQTSNDRHGVFSFV